MRQTATVLQLFHRRAMLEQRWARHLLVMVREEVVQGVAGEEGVALIMMIKQCQAKYIIQVFFSKHSTSTF